MVLSSPMWETQGRNRRNGLLIRALIFMRRVHSATWPSSRSGRTIRIVALRRTEQERPEDTSAMDGSERCDIVKSQ